jgi:flagellar biosynthesis protein FlhA
MVIPLPTYALDFLLTLNISVALLILMLTIYIAAPLELSVFPGLLLVITLFRLSLNVASTRLILSKADAGQLIEAFGEVVVQGNYILGFIIFVIVIIIQFVVITKGSGRVAEVAARFTLDAMPGKQMAIDADLNAGLIDEQEARRRREEISHEADFYGAMDGASKFVRGDAVAGILITLINIIGGFAIGVLQRDLSFIEALETYTLLTVGDGLVTQIPALITSTAAGIIVTRANTDENLGKDINQQLTGRPQALLIAGGILICLGFLPGLPTWPFLSIGAVLTGIGLQVSRRQHRQRDTELAAEEEQAKPIERPEDYLRFHMLEVHIGYQLVPLADARQGGELVDKIAEIRKEIARELGFIVPLVRVLDDFQLQPNQYQFKMKGVAIAQDELQPKLLMALDPGFTEGEIEGIEATDPAFGLPARWINPDQREKAELLGYNVFESTEVLITHLDEVIRVHASELLGRQETQHLIDEFKGTNGAVVEELIPNIMSLGKVQRVLQNLLEERVSIRDLHTILETLADYGSEIKDPEVLTEYVRTALRRSICTGILKDAPDENIPVLTVAPDAELQIKEAMQSTPVGINVGLEPGLVTHLFASVTVLVDQMIANGQQPTVLCSPQIRLAFRKLTAANFPSFHVLSYNEIAPDVEITAVGVITMSYEDSQVRSAEYAGSPATSA